MNSVGTVKPTADTLVTLHGFYSYSDTFNEKTTLIITFLSISKIF